MKPGLRTRSGVLTRHASDWLGLYHYGHPTLQRPELELDSVERRVRIHTSQSGSGNS